MRSQGVPIYSWLTIGDIEGINRYCSQLVSIPTIGLELNLDWILSGSGFAGNEVTGGFPFTAGKTIGDVEGVNTYCFHLGWMAYGTSPPSGFKSWFNSFWDGLCWDMVLLKESRDTVSTPTVGLLGMRSQEGSQIQLGWLFRTLKVSTHTVSTATIQELNPDPFQGGSIQELNPDLIPSNGVPKWNAIAKKNKNRIRI